VLVTRATGVWNRDEEKGGEAMTRVIFIHGTGVRDDEFHDEFTVTYDRIKAGFAAEATDVDVERCYWGAIGAKLNADGKSFYFDPYRNRESRRGGNDAVTDPEAKEERELAQWARLIDDPLFELRLEKMTGQERGGLAGPTLGQRVLELRKNEQLANELDDCGLTEAFERAVESLIESAEFTPFFAESRAKDGDTLPLLSRALVAGCLARAAEDGLDVTGERRDQLVSLVWKAFNVQADYGAVEGVGEAWTNLEYRSISPWLKRKRRATVDQMADVVFYQAHGAGIRGYLKDCIRKAPGEVVLLGHSLGGVIAFDLLAGKQRDRLDQVRMLITVGSQVPLLYELRALSCGINYGSPLPDGFPQWINVYDKHDLLAYAGEQLFDGRCRDIELNTKTPFPTAHRAYWDRKSGLYGKLAEEMRAEGLCQQKR
jgi:hypothetical protein